MNKPGTICWFCCLAAHFLCWNPVRVVFVPRFSSSTWTQKSKSTVTYIMTYAVVGVMMDWRGMKRKFARLMACKHWNQYIALCVMSRNCSRKRKLFFLSLFFPSTMQTSPLPLPRDKMINLMIVATTVQKKASWVASSSGQQLWLILCCTAGDDIQFKQSMK